MTVTTLIVEDDEGLRSSIEKSFRKRGHDVVGAPLISAAKKIVCERKIDLILLDIRLPDGSGLDFLTEICDLDEEIIVIIVTAFPDVKTAVRAIKAGANDFIIKPFELDELHLTVERALASRKLRHDVRRLEHEHQRRRDVGEILGDSAVIGRLREQIRKVAEAGIPLLITGETGTGKELIAESVHRLSARRRHPLIKVNCSALSEQLLESELFGHEKGAFTDAGTARAGLFEMCDGGSLLLDEISEMRADLQAKLLRVVEGQPFHRVGGHREVRTDVRVMAATNRRLPSLVQSGLFREDLYYRLNAFEVVAPPLRVRGSDVVLLAQEFLRRSAKALRKGSLRFTAAAEEALLSYAWPGNVRELRNVIERAVILCESREIAVEHLPGQLQAGSFIQREADSAGRETPTLAEIERRYVAHVLDQTNGNLSETARILGIARNTLKARLASSDRPHQ